MKKLLITVFIFFNVINLFANVFIDTTYFFNVFDTKYVCIYMVKDNSSIVFMANRKDFNITSKLYLKKIRNVELIYKNCFIENNEIGSHEDGRFIGNYLLGKGILLPIEFCYIWDEEKKKFSNNRVVSFDLPMLTINGDVSSYSFEQWKRYKDVIQFYSSPITNWGRVGIFETGIKNISESSFLAENTKQGFIEYKAENIFEKLYYIHDDELYCHVKYDSLTPPWVEGKAGYGIDEYLDIEFKWASDELQILNGFVDFTRMNLYEENSRVKTILIESEEPKFSKEYELEDIVRYNVIQLPQKTDKIRITIKDVYPGTKYQDTCLSSILITNPNVPSYEEMSEKILEAMKNGIYDRRYDKSEPLPDFIKVIEE